MWFTEKQMNMLGHNHVSCDHKPVSLTYGFQLFLKNDTGSLALEKRFPSITTEGQEVKLPRMLEADEGRWPRSRIAFPYSFEGAPGPSLLGTGDISRLELTC